MLPYYRVSMSSGPLTIICLPDLKLAESPAPAEVESALSKAVAAAGLQELSQLRLGLHRVVVSHYPLSFQVASLFLPVDHLMTDPEALSSAPISAATDDDVSSWIQSTGFADNWFTLPPHQPLDYTVAANEGQGTVAVVPLSFYQRYAGSASALAHTLVEYGRESVSKPVVVVAQAKRAVPPASPPQPKVLLPSRHDLDVQLAQVEVAVLQEIHSLAVPQHQQHSQALQTSLVSTVSKALAGHYTLTTELKTPSAPFSDSNTREMSSELVKVMESIVGIHKKAKNLKQKLEERGYK